MKVSPSVPPRHPPCDRLAVYGAPDGSVVRVPIPAGVVPQGLCSVAGRARFLVCVIDATDPRSDRDLVEAALAETRDADQPRVRPITDAATRVRRCAPAARPFSRPTED